jgi:hypothetical protein
MISLGINIIKIIHFLLLLFILLAPFYGKTLLLKCIIILLYILYKWKVDGSCLLTKLEFFLLDKKKEEKGFIYRIINPLYSEEEFDNNLEYITFYWIVFLIIIYLIRFV